MTMISILRERFRQEPAFTSKDAKRRLGVNVSEKYVDLMLYNLAKRNEIFRISQGIYTFREEMQVVGFAFRPFYYGLEDALSLRNLWEQECVPVVVTPGRARSGIRTFLSRNYVVKRVSRSMFFGFETIRYGDFYIPVSDAEKTLIDFVHFRKHLPTETLREIKGAARKDVLEGYLRRVGPWLAKRVRQKLK